jgi:FKBP-type peptidyl-prolyl cis-trans isomerase FkpA
MRDAWAGRTHEVNAASQALNERIGRRLQEVEQEEAKVLNALLQDPARREKYLNDLCRSMNLERSDSGLAHGVQGLAGSVRPESNDTVVVTWTVRAADMKTELSQLNVSKASFKVSQLLPGLAEGVQMMSAGSAALFVLPPDLSFGAEGWPAGIERGTPLVFMVRLEQIIPGS